MRREEFEALYEAHAQDLFAFLAYRTGDRALAEDLAADTFERAFKARRRFDPAKASDRTWLYSIALNRLRDHLRRSASRDLGSLEDEIAMPQAAGDPLDATRTRLDVMDALEGLTAVEREAVALRFGAQLTVPEIAQVTDEELTTAEGRLYRAMRKLRKVLDKPPV